MALGDMMAQGGPPPSIPVPSGGGAGDVGYPGDPAGGPQGPDASGGGPEALVTKAIDLIRQALTQEPDHEDKLLLEKITTQAQQYLATQQKTTDQAMGAGPGAKAVRKASGGTSSGY